MNANTLDLLDRALINRLQAGFPICEYPYAAVAAELGITEQALLERLQSLLEDGVLTRFGPLFNAERLGGAYALCAVSAPEADKNQVIQIINAFPETAHHYEREHHYNLWFVLGAEHPQRIAAVITRIEQKTGLEVLYLPKQREFCLHLQFSV